ncbi:MBL fold metallo-hydrolase [Sphingomonas sp. SRS2]|uniref:MBL fold metallo-hydrolase n=1 Tax=Sphingomonas sp. SRS2 TaxID=133190 RepID=UPI0006183EFA|nr:MBL fold metallo-hydrolase [Sphingomonas sp. SRS2]KKC24175.1 hypothetical protein WP12_20730 [Sphingomonas sp. SRS2]
MQGGYTKGLHELGRGCWAWLQPDGGWGWSNAGLVTDGECSLLVDTLYDLNMTATMLGAMRDASDAARHIDILVNSHADADHTYGNKLVGDARIIASSATAAEFMKLTPEKHQEMIDNAESLGEGAKYIASWAKASGFDFRGYGLVLPTETYEREMTLKVGDKDVRLINVGPAHTPGDTLIHSVQDKVVYTGDILFINVHPAVWEGSIDGWLAACDLIMDLDVDVVVPGHGPLTDKKGVGIFKTYMENLRREARKRFEAGMGVEEAAADIELAPPFDSWLLPERMAGSVNFLYRQWGSPDAKTDFLEIFGMMARYAKRHAACLAGHHPSGCRHTH